MNNPPTSPVAREPLDEFIRQLFVCHWVLGQMITGMLERARSGQHDADEEPFASDHYSMIRRAIAAVVDRHGSQQIAAATELLDELMAAISDDSRIFPPGQTETTRLTDRHTGRRRVRRHRR